MTSSNSLMAVRVTVDDREGASGLAERLAALWEPVFEGRLGVGDVEIGRRIVVERKTVADFASSLADGRLFRQASALARRVQRPLLIVEGEDSLDAAGLDPKALRGVLLTLVSGFRIPLLRTSSTEESAVLLAQLAGQESRRLARIGDANKNSRGSPGIPLDVLGAIPGVGDRRARRLVSRFGSAGAVLAASDAELRGTPGIGEETARSIRSAAGGGRSNSDVAPRARPPGVP